MMTPWSFSALLSALLFVVPDVSAAYRCERQGRVTYTDQRCERDAGTVERDIGSFSAPTRASPSPAGDGGDDRQSRRERAEVARLQALREQRERQEQQIRDLANRGAAARERKCRALALQRKWREEDLREAPLEKAAKARTRLRRATEKYDTECR